MSHLTEITLSTGEMDKPEVDSFANGLLFTTQLKSLSILGAKIHGGHVEKFVKSLERLEKLEALDLSGNLLGIPGALLLSRAIYKLHNLHSLKLAGNCILTEGA